MSVWYDEQINEIILLNELDTAWYPRMKLPHCRLIYIGEFE